VEKVSFALLSPELVGNVPGAVSQVTLWITAFAAQSKVMVPAGIVSGVGVN